MDVKKARAGLKLCKKPTRQWLNALREPTEKLVKQLGKSHLQKHLKDAGPNNKNYWGLLQAVYTYHTYYIAYVRRSNGMRKVPLPMAYNYDVDGFIEFIMDTGIPSPDIEEPHLHLIKEELGYVPGNFVWVEKDEAVRSKTGKRQRKKVKAETQPCIIYHCQPYYLVQGSETEYQWLLSREEGKGGLRSEVVGQVQQKTLRHEVWKNNYGPIPDGGVVQYKDPDGDLTHPDNVHLTFVHEADGSRYRLRNLKQSWADMFSGYLKICLGCAGSYRRIDGKILWERKGKEGDLGPCEEHCIKAQSEESWKDRYGLTIPHAPVAKPAPWTATQLYVNRSGDDWLYEIDDSEAYYVEENDF